MVSEGWALAFRMYSTDYVREADDARTAIREIWQGEFTPSWEWLSRRRKGMVVIVGLQRP
jgi:endonuclease YncB( thermonuclease family)